MTRSADIAFVLLLQQMKSAFFHNAFIMMILCILIDLAVYRMLFIYYDHIIIITVFM